MNGAEKVTDVWEATAALCTTLGPTFTDEAACVLASVLVDTVEHAQLWAEITRRTASEAPEAAKTAGMWQNEPTPGLVTLLTTSPEQARLYAQSLAELASAGAGTEPIDLNRMTTAAFIAQTQLGAAGVGARSRDNPTPPKVETVETLLATLEDLIGLGNVKMEVKQQVEILRISQLRAERGMKNPATSKHMIFTGNPGTGKTTVARLVAKLYAALGILKKGHLVETDRSGLVGGFLGQTEEKTAKKVSEALGGVLFIDEAYSLAGDDYGQVAIDVLVKAVEDNRDSLVLIVAGYTAPMEQFVDANPGLESRLGKTIFFPDYTDDELVNIFTSMAHQGDYTTSEGCVEALKTVLVGMDRSENFGNARTVRNLFEAALTRQAWRLRTVDTPTDDQLRELRAEDLAGPPVLAEPGREPTF